MRTNQKLLELIEAHARATSEAVTRVSELLDDSRRAIYALRAELRLLSLRDPD